MKDKFENKCIQVLKAHRVNLSFNTSPKTDLQQKICKWIFDTFENSQFYQIILNNAHETRKDWLNCSFKPSFEIERGDYDNFINQIGLSSCEAAIVIFSFYQECSCDDYFFPHIGLWDMIVKVCQKWLKKEDLDHMDITAYDKGLLLYAFIGSDKFIHNFNRLFSKRLKNIPIH